VISFLPTVLCLSLAVGQDPAAVAVGSGEVRAELVTEVRRQIDSGLAQLEPVFPGLEVRPFTVFVHATAEELPESLARLRHPGAPGFALLGRHQIHLVIGDMKRSGAQLQSVVVHELVHELLDQFTRPQQAVLPRWFHEGLAQHLAGDTYLGASEEDLVWRVGVRRLPSFADISRGFPRDDDELRVAYGQSYSYVSWLVREIGLGAVIEVAANTDEQTSFQRALVRGLGRSTLELQDGWTDYLHYGSGAWWRVLLSQCFNMMLIVALPVFVVAWWRRRQQGRRVGEQMERRAARFPEEFEFDGPGEEPPAEQSADESEGKSA